MSILPVKRSRLQRLILKYQSKVDPCVLRILFKNCGTFSRKSYMEIIKLLQIAPTQDLINKHDFKVNVVVDILYIKIKISYFALSKLKRKQITL